MHITSFFQQAGSNKRQKTKHTFFTLRNLDVLDSLWFEYYVFFFFSKMCIRCVEEARPSVQNFPNYRVFTVKKIFFVHIFLYMTTHIIKLSKITWFIPCSNWCHKWQIGVSQKSHDSISTLSVCLDITVNFGLILMVLMTFFFFLQIKILLRVLIHITKHIHITAAAISVSNFWVSMYTTTLWDNF